jgi:hypothetical protein
MPGTLKRLSIATAIAAAVGVATLPSAASAGPAEDLVGGVQKTVDDTVKSVNGLLGGGGGAQPAPQPAPAPEPLAEGGTTEPGISGTNPHGQGEVLDLTTDAPLLEDIVGTVILGQSRGEQDAAGNYHGNVTVLSVSGLGIDVSFPTDEGETETSPLDPINEAVLDGLCTATDICLGILEFESATTANGSSNNFSVLRADVLDGTVSADAAQSEGNISDDGECQTADGSSTVADAGVGGILGDDVVSAETVTSESHSEACNDGSESATADSEVVDLTALDLDLGGLVETTLIGCEEGDTVDDPFSIVGGILGQALFDILGGVCNGDDTNGAQADSPYNVRKALGADILDLLQEALGTDLNLDISTSESLARAPGGDCPDPTDQSDPDCPPIDECPDPTDASDPDCPPIDDCPNPNNENDPDCPDITVESGGPGGPGGPSADDPDDDLPFTGADIGTLSLIGLGVMALGLALMAAADRRRRTVA